MRLFLIRHGETVDNVASLYAGSRDSALTNHGVLQCRRLAEHLASKLTPPSPPAPSTPSAEGAPASSSSSSRIYLFSSNLQRAVKTAEAIRHALGHPVSLRQLTELREKDFGSGEGQSFAVGARKDVPHVGAETSVAMRARADTFLEEHLLPLLGDRSPDTSSESSATVVVAHGIILSVLFRRLCDRFAREVQSGERSSAAASIDHVKPSWSNTGYLETTLSTTSTSNTPSDGNMQVLRVNATDHLKGLRKTRGGIGSARFDDKQKTIQSFFTKKRKLADAVE